MAAYYVYELSDPRDGSVFYVGKGKGNRIDAHEREARTGRVSRKCAHIREIECAGLKIGKAVIATFASEQDAFDFEAETICRYGLERLTNIAPGGGSPRGGISVYEDRVYVAGVSRILHRTNGQPPVLLVMGQRLDLAETFKGYSKKLGEIAGRRGLDWLNKVAGRHMVSYVSA